MTSRAKITAQKFVVNGGDQSFTRNSYVLHFGAYGWTRLIAYANSLDDAIEHCGEWLETHAPGLLANDYVTDAYNEAIAAGKSPDEAADEAIVDVTTLDCGRYVSDWGLVAENPTRGELADIFGTEPR